MDFLIKFITEETSTTVLLIISIIVFFIEYFRVKKLKKIAHQINVKFAAPLMPKLQRNLTEQEKEVINKTGFKFNRIQGDLLYFILLSFLLIFTLLRFKWDLKIIYGWFAIITSIYFLFQYYRFKEIKHLDLISPVMVVTGKLTYPLDHQPPKNKQISPCLIFFYVGETRFILDIQKKDIQNPNSIYNTLRRLEPGQPITLEYTPFSKTILKVGYASNTNLT